VTVVVRPIAAKSLAASKGVAGIRVWLVAWVALVAHHQGVAVGCGLGGDVAADIAGAAGLVVDDDGLAEAFAHLGCQGAGHDVGRPARRVGHHQPQGVGGPGFCSCSTRQTSAAKGSVKARRRERAGTAFLSKIAGTIMSAARDREDLSAMTLL